MTEPGPVGEAATQPAALAAGTRIGPYQVAERIGAGGMGEVYRAKDTKLGRDVALKVLPETFSRDPERVARFEREAQLLAAFNHANIASIHELEEFQGRHVLVLELVPGETLARRIARGAIPIDEALPLARQMAEALEAAHEKGIIHRDLKPSNVAVTPDGQVKLLDFGLAKAFAVEAAAGENDGQSTETEGATRAGQVLGTTRYMSPEQARGKPLDERTDIWSFGVVLYEMLTGKRLFSGETTSDVLASVIRDEPTWEALPDACPPAVTRLLRRCLRKEVRERLRHIGDARLELEDVEAGAALEPERGALAAVERRRWSRERRAWVAVSLVAAGLSAGLAVLLRPDASGPRPAAYFVFDTPEAPSWNAPVPSPDGRQVAFVAEHRLWIRPLASLTARPLAGTEGVRHPFWSPDGASLAFFAEEELPRIDLAGGTVERICTVSSGGQSGGAWSEDGTILFSDGARDTRRLYTVAARGGVARALTTLDAEREETLHGWPVLLPGERRFLFLIHSPRDESAGLHVASFDAPDERLRVVPERVRAAYGSGHLLFVREGTLLAQPFDVGRAELTGEPVAVGSAVLTAPLYPGWGYFSASPSGVLAYRERRESHVELAWLKRNGDRFGTVGAPGPYEQIALSPDETRIAAEIPDATGQVDLWVIDVARGVASRVTSGPGDARDPVWSPDSQELVFRSDYTLLRQGLRGEAASPVLAESETAGGFPSAESWSRDGKTLFYRILTGSTVWALPLEGGGKAESVLSVDSGLSEPKLSPDERWLAYISLESGAREIYIAPFRRPGERVRVSVDGGGQPKWRGDGKELCYLAPDGVLMAVDVRAGADGLEVGLPTRLFEVGEFYHATEDYAVSADGQRFLIKVPVEGGAAPRIHVVTNWPSLLER